MVTFSVYPILLHAKGFLQLPGEPELSVAFNQRSWRADWAFAWWAQWGPVSDRLCFMVTWKKEIHCALFPNLSKILWHLHVLTFQEPFGTEPTTIPNFPHLSGLHSKYELVLFNLASLDISSHQPIKVIKSLLPCFHRRKGITSLLHQKWEEHL